MIVHMMGGNSKNGIRAMGFCPVLAAVMLLFPVIVSSCMKIDKDNLVKLEKTYHEAEQARGKVEEELESLLKIQREALAQEGELQYVLRGLTIRGDDIDLEGIELETQGIERLRERLEEAVVGLNKISTSEHR